MKQHIVALVTLGCLATTAAQSQITDRYSPFYFDEKSTNTVILSGNIDLRSPLNFSRVISSLGSPSLLILSSDGGNVHAALTIAREVNRLGMTTLIPKGKGCYSACSFLFFAGHERYIDGELGVHQISSATSDLEAGQVTISDIIDVLGEFGVSNELIVDMLRTPPGSMHILSEAEIIAYGLNGRRARPAQEAPDNNIVSALQGKPTKEPKQLAPAAAPAEIINVVITSQFRSGDSVCPTPHSSRPVPLSLHPDGGHRDGNTGWFRFRVSTTEEGSNLIVKALSEVTGESAVSIPLANLATGRERVVYSNMIMPDHPNCGKIILYVGLQ